MGRDWQRNYIASIRGPQELIENFNEHIAAVATELNLNSYEAVGQILRWGMEEALNYVKDERRRGEIKRTLGKMQFLRAMQEERRVNREIRGAVAELGLERAYELARDAGIEPGVVDQILAKCQDNAGNDRADMIDWLSKELNDGEPKSTKVIKLEAIKAGVLPPINDPGHDRAWASLRQAASKYGYSKMGSWGEWQKVQL